MRLYYTLSNLTGIKDVLVHDIILSDENGNEIVISAVEAEGNDDNGHWKGIEIDDVEDDRLNATLIRNALSYDYKLTNCMLTGEWEEHAEITLEAEIVIKNSDGPVKERINLTPEPVTIEFDE